MPSIPKLPFSRRNFSDALKELVSALLFGFMPVFLGLLFAWLSSNTTVEKFIIKFLESGEALLLSSALVGPLIYVLLRTYGNLPSFSNLLGEGEDDSEGDKKKINLSIQFPFGWFYVSGIMLICVIAAGVFGFNSALTNKDKFLPENMRMLSIIIISASLSIFFLISITRNHVVDGAPDIMRSDTNDFLDEWGEE